MIKITDIERKMQQPLDAKLILSQNLALDGAELIPIDLGGRLLPQSVSINTLGKHLLKSAGDGDIHEIRNLMTRGAPFTADWLGTSPLHLAALNNHLEVCEILLRAGISRDARTKVDRTPLHMATYEGHIDIVECLLKNGADHDCRDLLGMTPLHWAAQNGHADIAATLIRHGATTTAMNKFGLSPSDIAFQVKRHDIIEIISMSIRDPHIATEHLKFEMGENSTDTETILDMHPTDHDHEIPLETVLIEDVESENSLDPERLEIHHAVDHAEEEEQTSHTNNNSFAESIKLLQQHGITMLPADENSILSSVMETGHSVVLTDVGKEVLNSVKSSENVVIEPVYEQAAESPKKKKIITVTPEEFLAMANTNLNQNNILKQLNGKLLHTPKSAVKRIVMKKNKIIPISPSINPSKLQKMESLTDIDSILRQLAEARMQAEDYKQKFIKKEAEAERYKQQLRLIMDAK